MGRWTSSAARGGLLLLLFLIGAVLPGTGIARQAQLPPIAIVATAAGADNDDPDGFLVAHSARPATVPAAPLVLGVLAVRKASVAAGPVTHAAGLYFP